MDPEGSVAPLLVKYSRKPVVSLTLKYLRVDMFRTYITNAGAAPLVPLFHRCLRGFLIEIALQSVRLRAEFRVHGAKYAIYKHEKHSDILLYLGPDLIDEEAAIGVYDCAAGASPLRKGFSIEVLAAASDCEHQVKSTTRPCML
jgi:hypothetical protein